MGLKVSPLCVCVLIQQMNREKLMKMANTVRTGGKGTVRRYVYLTLFYFQFSIRQCLCPLNLFVFYVIFRKKKAVHKTNTTDDKKLQSTLKRVGVNSIPGIEEVNIFKDDVVIQFINPKGKKISNLFFVFLNYKSLHLG